MKISVVTVCLNAADTIEATILSVLRQKYPDVEYLVVDGDSVDGTLDIIAKYEQHPNMKMICERDTGLYNAMNKSIDLCTGDYILFLNSGDVLLNEDVLGMVAEQAEKKLVYGNVIRQYSDGCKKEEYPGRHTVFRLLMSGRMPCHQAIFARTEMMRKYRFDESYRICADFDFLMRCQKNHESMQYIDVDVCKVDSVTGISSQKKNLEQMRKEDDRSIRENYYLFYLVMSIPKRLLRFLRDKGLI